MRKHVRIAWVGLLSILWFTPGLSSAGGDDSVKQETWRETLVASLGSVCRGHTGPLRAVARALQDFPEDRMRLEIVADWIAQDGLADGLSGEAIGRVVGDLGPAGAACRAELDALSKSSTPVSDRRWAELYLRACEARRALRLHPYRDELGRIVFTKHYDLGGSHYAYTEGQSDAQNERHFQPGTSLCVLEMDGPYGTVRTLVDDAEGVIRDPDVSYDALRVLFAWKKSDRSDDYHLYEINIADGEIRQLTSGLGFADYEGAYLPNGDIVFTSSRCVQIVDCWWTEVSNLFTCDADGRHMRQLNFDQVHDNLPTVTHDGRVIYTRWDYNDRGQIYPQGLFQMYQDGTGQTELYGNNSYFPTTILHARSIPDTGKFVCVISGHHTHQNGWLAILEPRKGRQENQGVQLIAPVRETPAVRVDRLGQEGDQFQYPYPLSETEFLVTFRPEKAPRFGIYFVTIDGQRELLASDPKISCNQPIPLRPRPVPPVRPNLADYRRNTGAIYLQDVYAGPGLEGVPRGTVKQLRVVALDFRAAGIGSNGNRGPAGGALISTPISIEGAWDVKKILGTATVHDDGSACFIVPARTPLYFQALDQKGRMVQSMRSWVTLQPGESVSCVGCHESKNSAPPVGRATEAMVAGPEVLKPFYGPPRGFSFVKEVQPILDGHCVRCHYLDEPPKYSQQGGWGPAQRAPRGVSWGQPPADRQPPSGQPPSGSGPKESAEVKPAFSLKGTQTLDRGAQRKWSDSYRALADRDVCSWVNVQSAPPMLPPYTAGASQSRLITLLEDGSHYGVELSRPELDRFMAWIDLLVPYAGDYTEAMAEDQIPRYNQFLEKRRRWHAEEAENIARYLQEQD